MHKLAGNKNMEDLWRLYGIALTGGIACGKSTVAKLLLELRYPVIDADQLAREAVDYGTPGLTSIQEVFGTEVITPSGLLDRKKMREFIAGQPEMRQRLEQIVHPEIRRLSNLRLISLGLDQKPARWFYEASLIFETNSESRFYEVWVARCSPETQLARLMARDAFTRDEALAMIAMQMDPQEKVQRAHWSIDTEDDLGKIRETLKMRLDTTTLGGR